LCLESTRSDTPANPHYGRPTIEESHASAFSRTSVNVDDSGAPRPRRNRRQSVSERFISSLAQSGYKATSGDRNEMIHASTFTISLPGKRYYDGNENLTHEFLMRPMMMRAFKQLLFTFISEFLTDSFVLVFFMVFTLFFCQIGIEVLYENEKKYTSDHGKII